MRVLMLPLRFFAAFVGWATASALVIVLVAGVTRGHAPAALVIGGPLLALCVGAIAGTIAWRTSRTHSVQTAGFIALLLAAFAIAAVVGGAAVKG